MADIRIGNYENEIVLHFQSEQRRIKAYTLASTLVSVADAIRRANAVINPGYDVDVFVEALSDGSFRAIIRAAYKELRNLFSVESLRAIVLAVLAAYIYEHTLGRDPEVHVHVDESQVVVEQGDNRVIVPREVYEVKKEVEQSAPFKRALSDTFLVLEGDDEVRGFGVAPDLQSVPDRLIPHERFGDLTVGVQVSEDEREVIETVTLQILRAILERSKRKWQFVWNGITISAPILDKSFYDDFFSHRITIAPGDSLECEMKIRQRKDPDTGIITNTGYEIVRVLNHIPRLQAQKLIE